LDEQHTTLERLGLIKKVVLSSTASTVCINNGDLPLLAFRRQHEGGMLSNKAFNQLFNFS